jgi:hypothetical protein
MNATSIPYVVKGGDSFCEKYDIDLQQSFFFFPCKKQGFLLI